LTKGKAPLISVGLALALYGLISLAFEILILISSYDRLVLTVWAALNPLFVVYVLNSNMAGTLSSLSLFANVSTTPLAIATLLFWLWPCAFIASGFTVVVASRD
jgi:hypothetical protein